MRSFIPLSCAFVLWAGATAAAEPGEPATPSAAPAPIHPASEAKPYIATMHPGWQGADLDESAVAALGGRVDAVGRSMVRVMLPERALPAVAALPGVALVRPPHRPIPTGNVTEGVALTQADLFHAQGLLGQGVKIAVIDENFEFLDSFIYWGDVPAYLLDEPGHYREFNAPSAGHWFHGMVSLEIIHEMAPEAELFAYRVVDELGLEQAVDAAIAEGIDVIVHPMVWFNTSFYDGTGPISDIVEVASAAGILWVNSTGNHADKHWTGTFTDSDGDGVHEFPWALEHLPVSYNDSSVEWYTCEGVGLCGHVWINWDEYPSGTTDLDLYVHDRRGRLIGSSTTRQTGSAPPTEELIFLWEQSRAPYRISIRRHAGAGNPRVHLFADNIDIVDYAVAAQSLLDPAPAASALSVGGVHYQLWSTPIVELYSGQGPTSAGGAKPDIAGPVSATTSYNNMPGTSFAAAHVGGAAALLWQLYPSKTAFQIKDQLMADAVDGGTPGFDYELGAGLLRLMLPPCASDLDCDDGRQCTVDTCDVPSGTCLYGNACDDGNACTTDACDEVTGCDTPAPIQCDDGEFCNGTETCDIAIGCVAGERPCAAGMTCLEDVDRCTGACDYDGTCELGESCGNCSDCPGKLSGPANKRFCCGNGVVEPSETAALCDGNF